MRCMSDEMWGGMSPDERKAFVRYEADALMHVLTMLDAGLAIRRAGLIWFLPLCHDAYGENV